LSVASPVRGCWIRNSIGEVASLLRLDVGQELTVPGFTKEVASVEVALAPRFFSGLGELPVVISEADAASDGLVLLGSLVVTEPIVCEA
jgi:hypothetical protein